MRWSILAFCVGVLAVQCLRELPGLPLVGGLLCLALPAVRYRCWPLVALFLGLGWAVWRAHCALEARLPVALEDQALQIEGRVLGLPEAAPRLTRFAFKPSQLSLDGRPLALRPRDQVPSGRPSAGRSTDPCLKTEASIVIGTLGSVVVPSWTHTRWLIRHSSPRRS